ncbi:hypothetical protein JAAARDRAFT_666044 [Jaapia argillacea MUCL 33604]|uniref:BTB domain-containing protein n=1 Tax=Jaapia argillacea MUCL 33604 TaxID=933084 RepID=A0A067Q701_9AGAM|nr:hypothetical protein JAAARDRAFT_666044 [Jaapia argillacea MUCL 33604]
MATPLDSPLVRIEDFRYTDGSVVLQAERTLFRVHMSILSDHSRVFKDMFPLPQQTTVAGSKLHEGRPPVQVQDTVDD